VASILEAIEGWLEVQEERGAARPAAEGVEPGCARCLGLTRRDLEILAERYAALCTRVGGA